MTSKKKEASAAALPGLYAELHSLSQAEEFEKIIKVANRILTIDKAAIKAFQYKIISLINLDKFDDCLKQMSSSTKLASELHFERAYCLYRLNRNAEALDAIDTAPQLDIRLKELRAQLFYKQDRFAEAHQAYREVIKNADDDFGEEREANLAAVLAQLKMNGETSGDTAETGDGTYELLYNGACRLLAAGRCRAAVQQLQLAAQLCRDTLSQDGLDDDEIRQEAAIIEVQRAYCLQQLGEAAAAGAIYQEVLRHRPADASVLACASNNVVVLNGDQNVFDSRKRMRAVAAEGVDAKLARHQRRRIAVNQCLFSSLTHQGEQLQRHLAALAADYPEEAVTAALVRAAHLARRAPDQAAAVLQQTQPVTDADALRLQLARVQLNVNRDNLLEASRQLGELQDICRTPGVVSTRVALYVKAGDQKAAAALLSEAVQWHSKSKTGGMGEAAALWRQAADFSLSCGDARAAAASLEELRKLRPADVRTIAQLVTAYSQFDPARAQAVSAELPAPRLSAEFDVDALEATLWSSSGRPRMGARREGHPSPGSPSSPDTPADGLIQKTQKKRPKRKPRLPKNCNPNVKPDPERWLPRRERSSFKPKKRRRNEVMKGTQGGPSAQSDLYDITKNPTQQKAAVISDQPAQQKQMQRNAQKKKKGGKKNKW